jgi:thiol-disulfide isomerase/thioredoxin
LEKPKAILVRPRFDSATEYTYAFAEDILNHCLAAGIDVVELAEGDAIREKVEEELKKGTDLLIFYNHGGEDCLVGQDEKCAIDLENCHYLSEKEVYTLACLSAKELGAKVWRQGGKYWGYTEVVGFTTDALEEFKQAFNCGFCYLFIDKLDHGQALNLAKETFNQLSLDLVSQGKVFAAVYMRQNKENLVYYNGQEPSNDGGGCLLGLLKSPVTLFRFLVESWGWARRQ